MIEVMFYVLLSSEINAYQKQMKVISITSEMIFSLLRVLDYLSLTFPFT